MKSQQYFVFFILLLTIIVYACGTSWQIPVTTSIPVASLTLLPSISSPTITSSPAVVDIPTILPSTLTPLPTLNPEQALAKIRELFATNGNCKLPCWWGITLWESSPETTLRFWQTLTPDYSIDGSINSSRALAEFRFHVSKDMLYDGENFITARISIKNGTLTRLYIYSFDSLAYRLSSLLAENGKPDEIWISTAQDKVGNKVPFSIFLLYTQKGMLMSYSATGIVQRERIKGCVEVSPSLLIWIPEKEISFAGAEALFRLTSVA
jgi:hypothetical protein